MVLELSTYPLFVFSQVDILVAMTDCIFCKIINRELPCYKVYEDSEFLAFLDINPLNLGHSLIIPKKHYQWTWNVPNFGGYWEVALKITKGIMEGLNAERVQYITIGEKVPHAHIHVVPRYANDGHSDLPDWSKDKKFSVEEFNNAAKVITQNIQK